MAIDGETYEYTEMYPKMYDEAIAEGNDQAAKEAQNQIQESVEHAEEFKKVLELAAKRFKALQGAEKVHASKYQQMKQEIA
jgi:rubrerythrin